MRVSAGFACVALALGAPLVADAADVTPTGRVAIPAGVASPFQRVKANAADPARTSSKPIAAFGIDAEPVTNVEFLAFVSVHPEWRKSQIKTLFVDGRYLRRWRSDLDPGEGAAPAQPVTDVSWFAAKAYCKARGLGLPTTAQWEYALADAGRGQDEVRSRSLAWFAEPNGAGPKAIGGPANGYGVRDLIALVWEWTDDFNADAMSAETRDPNGKDGAAVCGGAAAGVADASDYPAFMRYAMRASLKANYTADNLGFRCAGGAP